MWSPLPAGDFLFVCVLLFSPLRLWDEGYLSVSRFLSDTLLPFLAWGLLLKVEY